MLELGISLSETEKQIVQEIPATSWFTKVKFANFVSPASPIDFDQNHEMKKALVGEWVKETVRDKKVLDLFSANGAFSFEAALAGAREVVGLEYDPARVACATRLAEILCKHRPDLALPRFIVGDVYDLHHLAYGPGFDVVLCLGGLYHVADPPFILDQIRGITRERLIVQTAQILPWPVNYGRFELRKPAQQEGWTSIVGGRGTWHMTADCFENMLAHAGFEIEENKRPPIWARRKYPWYAASCRIRGE